jgi:RNA polymerase subunit RPABC4/transcription elongation factor Spt4
MALTSCPACQNSVSEEAATCPKCGHPFRTTGNRIGLVLLLVIVIAGGVGAAIWWQRGVAERRARVEFLTAQMERCFRLRHLKMLGELGPVVRVRSDAERKQLADCEAYESELRELETR